MMTVLPILIALCLIVTSTLFIAVSLQRALTRTAILRRDLREGGPFHAVRYSVSEPAWPPQSSVRNLRKGAERPSRTALSRSTGKPRDHAEAA